MGKQTNKKEKSKLDLEDFDTIIGPSKEYTPEELESIKKFIAERRKNRLPEDRLKAMSLGYRFRMEDMDEKNQTKEKSLYNATVAEVSENLDRNKLSKKYRILDLFCGGGGVSMGIYLAGASEVVGVDIKNEPEYPSLTSENFTFIQADATTLTMDFLKSFDFIWASPPCQSYTFASARWRNLGKTYPDLVEPTRNML